MTPDGAPSRWARTWGAACMGLVSLAFWASLRVEPAHAKVFADDATLRIDEGPLQPLPPPNGPAVRPPGQPLWHGSEEADVSCPLSRAATQTPTSSSTALPTRTATPSHMPTRAPTGRRNTVGRTAEVSV